MLKIFVDSDVIISSLISSTGAASLLINSTKNLELWVSNISIKELETVTERLKLRKSRLKTLIKNQFNTIELKASSDLLKEEFSGFVSDENDAHIVAGAKKSRVQFLITYNTRHFKSEKLKKDLNILLATPANLLQYLRSIE